MKNAVSFRIYALSLLSFAMASFLLCHFALIWAYGKFYIYESNLLVLLFETTMIVAILSFSIFCMVEQIRGKRLYK